MVGNPIVAVAEAICELWEEKDGRANIDGTSVQSLLQQRDIHRVLVMDERFSLYGIITSFDFVRVMAES